MWKANKKGFHEFVTIAQDLLTPSMSTIILKYAFSTDRYIWNNRQSNLHPNIVETIIYMKNYVKVDFKLKNRVIEYIF